MALKLITPSTIDVVTLAEIKQHCRVDHADEDGLLLTYVKAAVSHLESRHGITGLCFGLSTWELYHDAFPAGPLRIPQRPISSIDKVEYIDPATSAYVEWPASNYDKDTASFHGWVAPISEWPRHADAMNAVRVTFRAGFGADNASVPESLRHAVRLLAGHWYEQREAVNVGNISTALPFAVDALVRQWREVVV